MNRERKFYTTAEVLLMTMRGLGIIMMVIAGFSIGLRSLRGPVDIPDNPMIHLLIFGIMVVGVATFFNLRARASSRVRGEDLKK